MWTYFALAVAVVVVLKVVATIVFATERVAVKRAEGRKNVELRARLERYTAQ